MWLSWVQNEKRLRSTFQIPSSTKK
jgi:hypothetical protein